MPPLVKSQNFEEGGGDLKRIQRYLHIQSLDWKGNGIIVSWYSTGAEMRRIKRDVLLNDHW